MGELQVVYEVPKIYTGPNHYCPGCFHGIIHRVIADILQEEKWDDIAIGLAPVGCAVLAYDYIDIDWFEAPHGRACANATGIKWAWPDRLVFTYQGDGDAASIGFAETSYAAIRGVNITTIMVNNAVYGMTGGQMAPTTLVGMKTTTSPYGRDPKYAGYPLKMAEHIAQFEGTALSVRVSAFDPQHVLEMKKWIKKAFQYQMEGKGYTFVEVVSTCPTNWRMDPVKAAEFVKNEMIKVYPLGVYKDVGEAKKEG